VLLANSPPPLVGVLEDDEGATELLELEELLEEEVEFVAFDELELLLELLAATTPSRRVKINFIICLKQTS